MVKSARLRNKSKLKTQRGLIKQQKLKKIKEKQQDKITSCQNVSAFATYLADSAQKKNEENTSDIIACASLCEIEEQSQNAKLGECKDHFLNDQKFGSLNVSNTTRDASNCAIKGENQSVNLMENEVPSLPEQELRLDKSLNAADVTDDASFCDIEVESSNANLGKDEDHSLCDRKLPLDESYFDAVDLAVSSLAEEETDVNYNASLTIPNECEQSRDPIYTDAERKWTIITFHPDQSRVLLLLHDDCKGVNIFGSGYIQSLTGVISVFGKTIVPGMEKTKFYAPVTHYALALTPIAETCNQDLNFEDYKLNQQAEDLCRHCKIVLLIKSLDDSEKLAGFPGFGELYKVRPFDGVIKGRLNEGSYVVESDKCFKKHPEYVSAYDRIAEFIESTLNRPVILTVGGKGTGKSTFNRFLVNKLLEKSSKIYYLDCDIGQPEFTPSAFVSLTLVKECLLGPPFTHSLSPLFSIYYGNITPSGLPDFYIECIKKTIKALPNDSFPVVVNTMGWNRALGLHLLIDTIRLVDPTHIIQIVSPKESKNLPLLTRSYLRKTSGWITDNNCVRVKHELVTMNIETFNADIVVYKSSDLRDLRLLKMLFNLVRLQPSITNGDAWSRLSLQSLSCIRPYKAKSKDLILCVAHESRIKTSDALTLFNASIVALCTLPHEKFQEYKKQNKTSLPPAPLCGCLGLGIVRGVDHQENALYIISGLCGEKMQSINCLVVGSLTIPESLFQESLKNKEFTEFERLPYTSQSLFQAKGSSKFRVYRSFVK